MIVPEGPVVGDIRNEGQKHGVNEVEEREFEGV